MPDDILRMRATVVSEEALANIRALGREFGILPQRAAPGIRTLNTEFSRLGQTVRSLGNELRNAVPALGVFGLGAAGVGLAAAGLIRTLQNVSDRVVKLKYASLELGLSTQALRGFATAAEKVGIAPDTMSQSLANFKRNTDDFRFRIGGVREELIRMGAGPVVARIAAATTQLDALKEAFDFKEALMQADPSGVKARRFMEQIGLGAEAARLSWSQLRDEFAKAPMLSAEEIARAEQFKAALIDLGKAWEHLVEMAGISLMPELTADIQRLEQAIKLLGDFKASWAEWTKGPTDTSKRTPLWHPDTGLPPWLFDFSLGNPAAGLQELNRLPPAAVGRNPLLQMPGGTGAGPGYTPMAFHEGFQGGGDLSEGSRMVKEGVFAALVDFQSYVQAGGGAAGGGGFTPATYSTGGGAGSAVGGGGGGPVVRGGGGPMGMGGAGGGGGGGGAGPDAQPGGTAPTGGGEGLPGGSVPKEVMDEARTMLMRGGSTGQLQQFMASKGYPKNGAWCGQFVASVVTQAGGKPPAGAATASNWLGWGEHVDPKDVREGDVAVRTRSRYGGAAVPGRTGGHVALVGAVGEKQFERVGGNQGAPSVPTSRYSGEYEFRRGKAQQSAGPTGGGGSAEDRKIVKGSVFGSTHGFRDPSEPAGRRTASGASNVVPGIALPSREGLGKMYEVTTPDGRTFMLPQTDIGPAPRTGRGIDITSSAAARMGYTSKNFPTDQQFAYRRVDEAIATPNVNATGTVNVNVTAPQGTKTSAKSSGMFQNTTVRRHQQMQATEDVQGPG